MKKLFKNISKLVATGVVATGAYIGASKLFYNKAFTNAHDLSNDELLESFDNDLKEAYLSTYNRNRDWFINSNVKKIKVTSFDGYELNGELIINHETSNKYVVLVHGYHVESHSLLEQAYNFDHMGFNILMYDQRGFGASKSTSTSLGWYEQFDLVKWISQLIMMKPDAQIMLYGTSMGATSILMALGNELDSRVKVAVCDSGYARLKDVIDNNPNKTMSLLSKIFAPGIEFFAKQEQDFDFDDLDVIKMQSNAKVPLLIIHSDEDSIVDYKNAVEIYDNYPEEKELFTINGDVHAYGCYKDNYFEQISVFVSKFIN